MPTMTPASGNVPLYKGKVTRSWPQLPPELVRHIATFYLWDLAATSHTPQTWDAHHHWHQRMIYTSLRDAIQLEKNLMTICPQWSLALETHLFWQQAVTLIDPIDTLAHFGVLHPKLPNGRATTNSSSQAPQPIRLPPYRHFRNITGYSCYVCRINHPGNSTGLGTAKRIVVTPLLGHITICREHDRRRLAYCGVCCREPSPFEHSNHQTGTETIGCLENEDEETWPGLEATCRSCRTEWLWSRASKSPRDREAIGGKNLISEDWETRQCVDGFIDLAEGSIGDVLSLAREKWWLRKYTRLADMMSQALAAARFNNGERPGRGRYARGEGGDFGSLDDDLAEEEEEEEDDEDDPEVLQMTEEGGVRELALGDWARARILDGHWFSPADVWYGYTIPGHSTAVSATHPCPWAREPEPVRELADNTEDGEEEHPRSVFVNADIPPSFGLCEQAYVAHQRQMRVVLMPVMKNIVRRIVMECAASEGGREDPAVRVARMSLEDVVRMMREDEGVWFEGVDWAEKRRNDDAATRRQRQIEGAEEKARIVEEDSAVATSPISSSSLSSNGSSSTKSSDGSSITTSPVLSTTTLQTTPSPPPSDEGEKKEEEYSRPVTIPVSPVLDPPRLLRQIPYVPTTISHLPFYSMEALKTVWREACAPLYHCRCSICERAMAANAGANVNQANAPASQQTVERPKEVIIDPCLIADETDPPIVEIKLDEIELDGEGEDEVDEIDFERHEEEEGSEDGEPYDYSASPSPEPRPRKRSLDEVEYQDYDADGSRSPSVFRRDGTPPKRARKGGIEDVQPQEVDSPRRLRKRSSEELEEADAAISGKRLRLTPPIGSPRQVTNEYDDRVIARAVRCKKVSQADLERLIVFGEED
ncbi:hypothetical protein BDQ12DRAFT_674210 [Crucibulum laeve]|uniref:Uncharacterized protein n=1 Tax=Crucibulum laeve TaxID=68775 RepID=A0A5C3MIB4_9AGAR|nr:hypothetical protein BDQ12DRAFT_674210 [Crucibulum laeve]